MNEDQIQNTLSQLYGIEQPENVSFWPVAPGWYLIALIFVLCIVLFIYYQRKRKKYAYKRDALKILHTIKQNHHQGTSPVKTASEISGLLRRICRTHDSSFNSGLIQSDWLDSLNRLFQTNQYTDGPGKLLIALPYMKTQDIDISPLIELVEKNLESLK